MKIGFVLDDGLNKPDGVQQYILTLGTELVSRGHQVVYLVGETNTTHGAAKIYSMAKNVKVRFNGNALSIPLPASTQKIKTVLEDEKFDVLHVQVPYSPFMGAKVVKLSTPDTVIIGTFHVLPYGWLSRAGTKLLGIALSKNLQKFDSHIAVSQPAADFARFSFNINSHVIPNMVNTAEFRGVNRAKNTNIKLLFLGRLVHRKGCQQLLKALAILNSQDQLPEGLVLDICGDGPQRRELEKYTALNGLTKNVVFHGFVTNEQKIQFMRLADVSIFPSLSGESFGIVLIEAMAAGGGVVLGGHNPGYDSVMAGVPGCIVDVKSPGLMAKQLNEVLSSPEKRDRLYDLQQEHVKQFDTKVVATRVLAVYEACKKQKTNQ